MSSALDAVTKFRETPELVERLLPFLDSYSVWSLGQAHPLALQILKGSSLIWKDLVRRSCSDLGALDQDSQRHEDSKALPSRAAGHHLRKVSSDDSQQRLCSSELPQTCTSPSFNPRLHAP